MGNEERYSNPPPIITPTEKASVIERITPEHIIEELRHKLMGEIFLNDKRKWIQSPVLMFNAISERGAWDISNLLLSICNQNTALSKLDDKTIRKRAYAITEVAVKMMISNWTSYKITNTAQLNYIADIVYSLTLITLKMSDAEGIRKMVTSMYSESRNISEIESKKGGLFKKKEYGF